MKNCHAVLLDESLVQYVTECISMERLRSNMRECFLSAWGPSLMKGRSDPNILFQFQFPALV